MGTHPLLVGVDSEPAVPALSSEEPGYDRAPGYFVHVEVDGLVEQVATHLESDARLIGRKQPLDGRRISVVHGL